MPAIDNETFSIFRDEAKEHLDGIESDLLAIEEAGAAMDQELVNKVFRAMHSIKGGAGFLGLTQVKELAHAAENVLNKIRNSELVPSSENIGPLLKAADLLNSLIGALESGEAIDTSAHIAALEKVVTGEKADSGTKGEGRAEGTVVGPSPVGAADKTEPSGGVVAAVSTLDIDEAVVRTVLNVGKNLFLVQFDPTTEPPARGMNSQVFLEELALTGDVLGLIAAPGRKGGDAANSGVFVLFATILDKALTASVFGTDETRVFLLQPEQFDIPETAPPLREDAEGQSAVPKAAVSVQPDSPSASTPPTPPRETAPPASRTQTPASGAESSLRVNVKVLDSLMTLAGELVLTRNQLIQMVNSRSYQTLDTVSQRLDLVTSELQEAIMSTRMQPVGNVFNKFKRVVRDLSQSLGKQVDLVIEGGDVDLDKTIIEAIGDPLTHLVRNSVDHGIEMPEKRVAAGKPPEGLLRIAAFHEGGHVIIEIRDDGAGIDTEKVKQKAIAMGTHDRAQLDVMTPKELARLIFLPGLSTAEKVTDVSGRGVGMDVVHSNLARIGGVFDIESQVGRGTTITIKLPLTLAIVPSLIVTVGKERYAIPQVNMVELVRVPAQQVAKRIETIGNALVMRLRGELLPLVHLADVLGIGERTWQDLETGAFHVCRRGRVADRRATPSLMPAAEPVAGEDSGEIQPVEEKRSQVERRESPVSACNILVVSAGSFNFGLIVDRLLDSEEIVVKPLGAHLRGLKGYAGATVQGDGRVALILDVAGIAALMKLAAVNEMVREKQAIAATEDQGGKDAQTLLLMRNSADEHLAVPLGLVSRIEKIRASSIETTGGRRNIKYRGGALPLFAIEEAAKVKPLPDSPHYNVIVFPMMGREVGVLVSEVSDIVEFRGGVDDVTHRQTGIMGSAIIHEQITLLVDLYEVVSTIMPSWAILQQQKKEERQGRLLVVEDSPFFLKQIQSFLKEAGYEVITAMNGQEGLDALSKHSVDLVVTDIEMPVMNGLEMTSRIRQDPRWRNLPVIAVTSLAGEAAEKKGFAAGVNAYLVKLDREQVIGRIQQFLRGRAGT